MSGTEWDVERVEKIVDGDSLRVIRSRVMQLGDDHYRVTDIDSKLLRLVWVDTPERGQASYQEAREDLVVWIASRMSSGPLSVICYQSAGWDRILADLIDADGNSASQWMMAERGWPPYVDGKGQRPGSAA